MNQPEPPLLEGGQGRSGEDLEAEGVALAWLIGVAVLVLLISVVVVAVSEVGQ